MAASVQLRALCCGRLEFARELFFPGAAPDERMAAPVLGFVVQHARGTLLFDTGVACGAAADPVGVLGKRIAAHFNLAGSAQHNMLEQLAALGIARDAVTHVACSHLHFDHCGCNRWFPHARVLLQRAEMDAARAPGSRYDARLWDLPLDYQLLDGEHDVFGDGSVLLVPTPGHTAGHQSAIVRTAAQRRFVLAADACYTEEHLRSDIVPNLHWHEAAMRESMHWLRSQRAQGAELIFGHDAAQWAQVQAAHGALS
jgi:N-acyl homoserine lactone hydrolase